MEPSTKITLAAKGFSVGGPDTWVHPSKPDARLVYGGTFEVWRVVKVCPHCGCGEGVGADGVAPIRNRLQDAFKDFEKI